MAWPNENINLRKASRPLSIIDENPNDVRGHPKVRDDVMTKQMSQRSSTYTGHGKPTRRKAVAPLQHPVDLLLPNGTDTKETQAIHDHITNGVSNHNPRHDNASPHPSSLDMELLPWRDQMTNSDVNCNRLYYQDKDKHSFSNQNQNNTQPQGQLSEAEDFVLGVANLDSSQSYTTCVNRICNTSQANLHNNQCFSGTLSSDIKTFDENENENTTNCLQSKHDMPITKRPPHSYDKYSDKDNVLESPTNETFADQNDITSMFYLSNSATSLSFDDEEDVERKSESKKENDTDSMSLAEQITDESAKEISKDTNGDAEEVEWKNRVKKSRSFIKVRNNSSRPMRRSISDTFNSSSDTDSLHDNTSRSPGSLRRFLSQQMDSSCQIDDFSKSKPRLSLFRSGLDKHPLSLYQKSSNLHQLGDTPSFLSTKVADNQSNKQPIRRISAIDQSDFSLLKMTANRLHLQTRRPSVMAWKEKYMKHFVSTYPLNSWSNNGNERPEDKMEWSNENIERINTSLSMLRNELIDLRLQDQSLARQFLGLRQAMNSLRLTLQCKDHKELLDEAEEDIEELRELSQLVDLPPELLSPVSSLQNLGITRMNLSSRRFSTC